MPVTPAFAIVPPQEAARRRPNRRERRDWKPVLDALIAGRSLFLSEDELTDSNVKYLTLALSRRGKGERLRTQRTVRDMVAGRMIELAKENR